MDTVSVKISKKTYKLKFGYGVLRRLASWYDKETFEELGQYIDGLKLAEGTLSFNGLNFVSQLIIAAIKFQDNTVSDLDPDIIIDEIVFKDADKVAEIITAFYNSFPKQETATVGKQQQAQRKK